ncbi:DUF6327 family protein [Patiriisocius sp. Uisw_017]|jgi:hypothetical protein|uniref:DUF6327 family protein n=1 Tax=Patiriisocius sp. Uisw_017 TaxID=3230968 RepID=UPI0039EB92F2
MRKPYASFEEIDFDLKRLNLQAQINKEEVKLSLHKAKEKVTPSRLFGSFLESLTSSAFLFQLLAPIASYCIDKIRSSVDRKSKKK